MKKMLFTCSAVAVLSSALFAGDYSSNVNVYGGYNLADTDCVIDDAPVAGVNLHTFFNKNVGMRASYERVIDAEFNSGATSLSGGDSTSVNRFALNGVLKKATPWHKITPYILAGGGYEDYENGVKRASGSCSGQWFIDAGVGAAVALTDRLSINPEVRVLRKDKCETMDVVPTLGLAYAFGGAKTETQIVEKVVVKEVIKEVQVPGATTIVESCPVPTNYTDRCDNTYYVQVASELKCPDCDEAIKNRALINKLDANGYAHKNIVTTNMSGTQVNRLLVGPYKCKKDAFEALCEIKRKIKCDAFVYSTRK